MTFDAGRIRHDDGLMHYARASNGTAIPSNWIRSTDGTTAATWRPESASAVSYGSNSNDVTYANAAGASPLASHADHGHRGVTSLAHSSNTYTGPVTLETEGSLYIVRSAANTYRLGSTGGTGASALTVEEVDGSPTDSAITKIVFPNGTLSITSHVATYTAASSGGGGIGAPTYLGYNTIGASFDVPAVNSKTYFKQFTLSADAWVMSVGGYFHSAAGTSAGPACALFSDSSGVPLKLIGLGQGYAPVININTNGDRWIDLGFGVYLTSGTYWAAVRTTDSGAAVVLQLAYDTGGSDRTQTKGPNDWEDATGTVDSTHNHSIRIATTT